MPHFPMTSPLMRDTWVTSPMCSCFVPLVAMQHSAFIATSDGSLTIVLSLAFVYLGLAWNKKAFLIEAGKLRESRDIPFSEEVRRIRNE
jgi:hypothetical protein